VNFGNQKVRLSSSQSLKSSNSDHWRDCSLLPPHYFLLSWSLLLDMCHNHISPNFENDRKTHSKLEFQPKVESSANYKLGIGRGWQLVLLVEVEVHMSVQQCCGHKLKVEGEIIRTVVSTRNQWVFLHQINDFVLYTTELVAKILISLLAFRGCCKNLTSAATLVTLYYVTFDN